MDFVSIIQGLLLAFAVVVILMPGYIRFLRFAASSGAVEEDEVLAASGLVRSELFG